MKYLLFTLILTVQVNAVDSLATTDTIRDKILLVVQKEYPNIVVTVNDDGYVEMAYNTRKFTVYRPNMVGEWQKPWDEIAPDKNGVFIKFKVIEKKWDGQLVIPHVSTTDYYYYSESVVIKSNEMNTRYIWSDIQMPRIGAKTNVQKEVVSVFNSFK